VKTVIEARDANLVKGWSMKRHLRWLSLLSALALCARLAFLLAAGGLDDHLHDSMDDQRIYLSLARSVASGNGLTADYPIWISDPGAPTSIVPPLYPVVLGGVFSLFGPSLVTVRLLQTFLSLIVVCVAYLLACNLFNRRVGIMAGMLAALYPPLVMYVRPIMSETLFFPLLALLVWTTYTLQDSRSIARHVAFGAVAAFSVLTRSESVFLVGLLLVWLIHHQARRRIRLHILPYAALVVTLVGCLLPYALYNYSLGGSFAPFPNAKWKFWDHTWWAEMRLHPEWRGVLLPERRLVPDWEHRTEWERDNHLWNIATTFVRDNPGTFLVQRVRGLVRAYPVPPIEIIRAIRDRSTGSSRLPDGASYGPTSLDDVVTYTTLAEQVRVWAFRSVFVLAVCGIVFMLAQRQQQAYWLLLIPLWNVIHVMIFVGTERHRLQVDPYLIVFAAYCIDGLTVRLTRKGLTAHFRSTRIAS
jgi:4-amino-4-deoxy-L-arabinose transferase-like glycosyltransferase